MVVHTVALNCPRCSSRHIIKNGTTAQTKQRYRCKKCGKSFLFMLDYTYRACVPLLRSLIVPMTLNGSGIRDTVRVLNISANTVLNRLRRAASQVSEPMLPSSLAKVEMDEQWSFVGSKKNQRWLWHSLDHHSRRIAAFELGRRTDRMCHRLCYKLAAVEIEQYYTDDWKSYRKCLDARRHHIGKSGTQRIERCNLNFRTHLKRLQRRTICFSRSVEMHDCVLKLYIHHYNSTKHTSDT